MKRITRITAIAISVALLGALTTAAPALAAGPNCLQQQVVIETNCPQLGPVWPGHHYKSRRPVQPVQPEQPAQPTQPVQPVQPTQPGTTTPTAGISADEQQIINLVNAERTKAGLKALQADSQLSQMARAKSQDMVSNNYFDHQSPTYGSPFDMMKRFGITYRTAGENIAGNPSVQGAFQAWMKSPGHRENIMNPNYTKTGVGIVKGGQYGMMFTQEFVG